MASAAPHKHCIVCGNAIGEKESFCDELCEIRFKSAQRRQKIMFLIFTALIVLIMILPPIVATLKGKGL